MSQWVVLEYELTFYFRHCLLEERRCCLKSIPRGCYLIAAVKKNNIFFSFSLNVQYTEMEGGWAIGSFTLPLSISLKATSHLHLGHKASVTRVDHHHWKGGTWDLGIWGQNLGPQHAMFRTFGLLLNPLSCVPPFFSVFLQHLYIQFALY